MEKIYSKIYPEVLLHVINRKEKIIPPRQDLSPEKEYLQVSCLMLDKNKSSKPHKHIRQIRTTDITQESWIIIEGEIRIKLYDLDDKVIQETTLKPGDCLVTFQGGHELTALDPDTIIYECKTGPYLGKEKDNAQIDPKN